MPDPWLWTIGDFGESFLVRGTEDIDQARQLVRARLTTDAAFDLALEPDDPTVVELVDNSLHGLRPEVGWYRCNPCHCGEEHRFDMATADGPGRGNFRGVYFRA